MKKVIRLTESDLVQLVKKIVKEQWDDQSGYHSDDEKGNCPKKKSAQELLAHLKSQESSNEYFYCFEIPQSYRERMMGVKEGAFSWNKQANVLEIYKTKGPYLFFGGPYFGDKLGNIKMGKDFPSKFPLDFSLENGDFPYWSITENKVCLFIGRFC